MELDEETIQRVATTLNIPLDSPLAKEMLPDLQFRLKRIILDASTIMKHSKRTELLSHDISSALTMRNMNANTKSGTLRELHIDPLWFLDSAIKTTPLFADPNEEGLSLEEMINTTNETPSPLLNEKMEVHWLALKGVQPAIPANPLEFALKDQAPSKRVKLPADGKIIHILPKELQLYFEKVIATVRSGDTDIVKAALQSVSTDPGIQPIVPYLSQFVMQEVSQHTRNLPLLRGCMFLVEGVNSNPHLRIEAYLHQILPAVTTCAVSHHLCEHPREDHWTLRRHATDILVQLCKKYGSEYPTLQSRITELFVNVLSDPSKPLTSHFGAIVGLTAFGPSVVQLLIIPLLENYLSLLLPERESENPIKRLEAEKCYEALKEAVKTFANHLKQQFVPLGDQSKGSFADYGKERLEKNKDYTKIRKLFGELKD